MSRKSRFPSPFPVSRARYRNAYAAAMVVFQYEGIGLNTDISDIAMFFDCSKSTARRWVSDAVDMDWLKPVKRYEGTGNKWRWVFVLSGSMLDDLRGFNDHQFSRHNALPSPRVRENVYNSEAS